MGFRMSIEHNGIYYGEDHKLYGYVPFEELSSFNIILPEIKNNGVYRKSLIQREFIKPICVY